MSYTRRTPNIICDYIKQTESLILYPKKDPELTEEQLKQGKKQLWAIGYGNHYYEDGTEVSGNDEHITVERADSIFKASLSTFENGINQIFNNINLTDNQFGALISLAYNIGLGGFANTNLCSLIKNNPNDSKIKDVWLNCAITSNGQILPGLVRRRKEEYTYYTTGQLVVGATHVSTQSVIFGTEEDASNNTTKNRIRYVNTNYCNLISCDEEVKKDVVRGNGNSTPKEPEKPQTKSPSVYNRIWSAVQLATGVYENLKLDGIDTDRTPKITSVQERYTGYFSILAKPFNDWEKIGYYKVEIYVNDKGLWYNAFELIDDASADFFYNLDVEQNKKINEIWTYLKNQTEHTATVLDLETTVINSTTDIVQGNPPKTVIKKLGLYQYIFSNIRDAEKCYAIVETSDILSSECRGDVIKKGRILVECDKLKDYQYYIAALLFKGKENGVFYFHYFTTPQNHRMNANRSWFQQCSYYKYDYCNYKQNIKYFWKYVNSIWKKYNY